MSLTVKIAHVCNHAVPTVSEEKKSVTFLKSGDVVDILKDETISEIDYIVKGATLLFPRQHFSLVGDNRISWDIDAEYLPVEGEVLTAVFYSTATINKSYDAQSCARCGGNGWYASAADAGGLAIELATGVDKLVQDFLKILLTDSRYYVGGTALRSIIGQVIRSEADVSASIVMAVKEAETKLKQIQYEMLLSQKEVPSAELLRSAIIEEIEKLDSNDGYYLLISLVNEENFALRIGLDL